MQTAYVSELQLYFQSVHKVAELCEPDYFQSSLPSQPPIANATVSGDYVSLRQWMLEYVGEAHPSIAPAQSDPSPILRALHSLLIYGEALFLKYMPEVIGYWSALADSPRGDIPWNSALLASLVHCHACLLRELHDIPDDLLIRLLWAKHGFWEALSTVNILKLTETYSPEPFIVRNLLLDVIIDASQSRLRDELFFSRRGECISMTISLKRIRQIPIHFYQEVGQLLNQEEVKSIYLKICRNQQNPINERIYHSAISDFLSNLHFSNIHVVLMNVYGVTLTGRQVVIDNTEPLPGKHCTALKRAYVIVIMLHEYAHFLIRAPTNNVREYMNTATPTKKQTQSALQVQTQVRALIQDLFPLHEHGEAGYKLEKKLFGSELSYINAAASMILLKMAEEPMPLANFKREFGKANKLSEAESPRMLLNREGGRVGKDVMFFGRCGMPQPYSYY